MLLKIGLIVALLTVNVSMLSLPFDARDRYPIPTPDYRPYGHPAVRARTVKTYDTYDDETPSSSAGVILGTYDDINDETLETSNDETVKTFDDYDDETLLSSAEKTLETSNDETVQTYDDYDDEPSSLSTDEISSSSTDGMSSSSTDEISSSSTNEMSSSSTDETLVTSRDDSVNTYDDKTPSSSAGETLETSDDDTVKTYLYDDDTPVSDTPPLSGGKELNEMPPSTTGNKEFFLNLFFQANWLKASQFCRFHGMHLASFNSALEFETVLNLIDINGYSEHRFWTSGSDLGDPGKYYWMANGQPLIYTNWLGGEPNNEGIKQCVETWNNGVKGMTLMRNNDNCLVQKYFICEKYL